MFECAFVIGAYLAIVAVADTTDEEFELLLVRSWSHANVSLCDFISFDGNSRDCVT